MSNFEWPAEDYAVGNAIQAAISNQYLQELNIAYNARILDIGCGDGSYSTKIIQKAPQGSLLGIDRSMNMLEVAKRKIPAYPSLSFECLDVLDMHYIDDFDYIVSFWCLHWCFDLKQAFTNIHCALKKHGKVFVLLATEENPYIKGICDLMASQSFSYLQEMKLPFDFEQIKQVPSIIKHIPFKHAVAKFKTHTVSLPSLDIYRRFVKGLPLFNGQIPQEKILELHEALVKKYEQESLKNKQGEYLFKIGVYVISAEK